MYNNHTPARCVHAALARGQAGLTLCFSSLFFFKSDAALLQMFALGHQDESVQHNAVRGNLVGGNYLALHLSHARTHTHTVQKSPPPPPHRRHPFFLLPCFFTASLCLESIYLISFLQSSPTCPSSSPLEGNVTCEEKKLV